MMARRSGRDRVDHVSEIVRSCTRPGTLGMDRKPWIRFTRLLQRLGRQEYHECRVNGLRSISMEAE